jgi:hypothetical protein
MSSGKPVVPAILFPACLLFAASLPAASIRGTVSEYQTSRLLARALVTLEPVYGTPGEARSVRTDRYGNFEFSSLPAGAYLVTATRRYYIPVQYGQKRWNSAGFPVTLADSDVPFLTIQMFRYGAVAGTVVDENDVGLPEQEIAAYTNTRPPQLVASAKADERGMYRIYGLEPGSYLVRTKGEKSDEGSFLPTFARETLTVDQAYPIDVAVNQQVDNINVRPIQGVLYSLSVLISDPYRDPEPPPITVTLASDMGRRTTKTYDSRFTGLMPGQYEIFAETPPFEGHPPYGLYLRFAVSKDTDLGLSLQEIRPTSFSFVGASMNDIQVLARRKDLAGPGPAAVLSFDRNSAMLAPGPWQLALMPLNGYYVQNFFGPRTAYSRDQRADGWNDTVVSGYGSVRFTLSPNCGSVHGMVKSAGEPVAGAPVFLESVDLPVEKRITETYSTRTDMHGQYRITGLAPGNYRVLATFEYLKADTALMTAANAHAFRIEERNDTPQDLDLYGIR